MISSYFYEIFLIKGAVKGHQHFGAVPMVLLAAMIGHVVGRISYSSQCDEKLRELPGNSRLGNLMREYHKAKNPPPKK